MREASGSDALESPGPEDETAGPAAVATPLLAPRDGTPPVVMDREGLLLAIQALGAGTGPVAVDAERASGYRYSSAGPTWCSCDARAPARYCLILCRSEIVSPLGEAIADAEWVLHAASQDLPCLAEIGLRPKRLFDTELAARLAGFERVGLAALTESMLGFSLEKHHSAADWSTRPLPESWLTYAALDVELLIDLRHLLADELTRQGKAEWAAEEFESLATFGGQPARPRQDPWRRTSGIHRVRGARALARVRALWYARDTVASRRDTAPGRILADAAIVAAAEMDPADERSLLLLPGFGGRSVRRLAGTWLEALDEARALPASALPVPTPTDGLPPAHRWAERDPAAAARLARARTAVNEIAQAHDLPPENLITPDTVRRLAWEPPTDLSIETVCEFLRSHGARNWQITLVAEPLAAAMPPR